MPQKDVVSTHGPAFSDSPMQSAWWIVERTPYGRRIVRDEAPSLESALYWRDYWESWANGGRRSTFVVTRIRALTPTSA